MNNNIKELKEHSAQIFELGCMERPVYLKEDVDAVIAGLKQKLQDQCISCPVKMQEDDVVSELKAENERLKKCEIWMKQHFYCEEVIACESAKKRRLKRALWLARAYRGRDNSILLPSKFMRNVWDNVERKCRAKAEEYK